MSAREFPLRRSRWGWIFVRPLAWGRIAATIDSEGVTVRIGALGGGTIPLRVIDRIGRMDWPWWGGLGVRLGRGIIAFVPAGGECALLELSEPVKLRAPLPWRTQKVVIAAAELEEFIDALAAARREVDSIR